VSGEGAAAEEEELPRLCHVRKAQPDDEYGFNLHAEKNRGHFVGKVDAGSVAEKAGLIQGHRIVGVNGTLVHPKTPHKVELKRFLVKIYDFSSKIDF